MRRRLSRAIAGAGVAAVALAALTGAGGVIAPVTDAQTSSFPCCKSGT